MKQGIWIVTYDPAADGGIVCACPDEATATAVAAWLNKEDGIAADAWDAARAEQLDLVRSVEEMRTVRARWSAEIEQALAERRKSRP